MSYDLLSKFMIPILEMDFLKDPAYRPVLSILKGLRNGAVYGAKIRFPHALVMTFLFRQGR